MTDPKRPEDADVDEEAAEAADVAAEAADDQAELDAADAELDAVEQEEVEDALAAEYAAEAETPPVVAPSKPAASRDRAAKPATTAPIADELPHADDRVSKLWVGLIVATFIVILIYGLLFGRGGVLTPQPTEEPTDSPAPSVLLTPSPVRTPGPSVTLGASGSPQGSLTAAPSSSPAPTSTSVSPTAPPTPSPTPGPT